MSKIPTRNKKNAQKKPLMEPCHSKLGQLIEMEKAKINSVQRIKPIIIDPKILKLARAKVDVVYDHINDAIRHCGWERARKSEIVIKALMDVGIDPEKCFFDQKDNLIIPFTQIDTTKENLKYFRKCYMKVAFTKWERIKLFFKRNVL